MRIFDIVKDINSFSITENTQHVRNIVTQPPHFKIKPMLNTALIV
jgi:hypothetical protein